MSEPASKQITLDTWIALEAISFDLDTPASFHAAVDRVIAALGESVELLGLGEPMHGAEEFLVLRNRLFQRLVEAHGYTAIAVESSFPRSRLVNDYVTDGRAGAAASSYDAIQDTGFSHNFGRSQANRQLVEWMREYNAAGSHAVKLQFYGFDGPMEMMTTDSPVGSSRVDLQACKLEYSIVSPK